MLVQINGKIEISYEDTYVRCIVINNISYMFRKRYLFGHASSINILKHASAVEYVSLHKYDEEVLNLFHTCKFCRFNNICYALELFDSKKCQIYNLYMLNSAIFVRDTISYAYTDVP